MREIRAAGIVLVLASAVAACQSGTAAGPRASAALAPVASLPPASLAPTPSPTPIDVAALAMAKLRDPSLKARVAIDATTTVGSTKTTSSGVLEIDGAASHLARTDTTGRSKARSEAIVAGGSRYDLEKGVWVRLGDADGSDLASILRTTALASLGMEVRDGVSLHHLRSTTPATTSAELAAASSGVATASTTVDAWVQDDGTPVTAILTSTWDQVVGKESQPASRTATLAFEPLGAGVDVSAPADVWAFFISTRNGYRIGHPADWSVKPGSATLADGFGGADRYVYASRARQKNVDLAYLAKRMPGELASITGYSKIVVDRIAKATLDGVAARRVDWHGTFDGKRVYGQAIVTVKGAWWYFVGMEQLAKTDAAARTFFDTVIGTFDFR